MFEKVFKYVILKWLNESTLEQIAILSLRRLVEKTDNKIDDEIFNIIFEKHTDTTEDKVEE